MDLKSLLNFPNTLNPPPQFKSSGFAPKILEYWYMLLSALSAASLGVGNTRIEQRKAEFHLSGASDLRDRLAQASHFGQTHILGRGGRWAVHEVSK